MSHSEKTGADISDMAIIRCAGGATQLRWNTGSQSFLIGLKALMNIHGTASLPFKPFVFSTFWKLRNKKVRYVAVFLDVVVTWL